VSTEDWSRVAVDRPYPKGVVTTDRYDPSISKDSHGGGGALDGRVRVTIRVRGWETVTAAVEVVVPCSGGLV